MNNQEWDNLLNIHTTNERDWQASIYEFHRLESTDYEVLELLSEHLDLDKNDQFVDMGCGTGRAMFFMHYKFGIPVTGIELHPVTFEELENNKESYSKRFKPKEEEIMLIHNYADDYIIQPLDNVFYFFNPFSLSIFLNIMQNIKASLSKFPREITLILYYPERLVLQFLNNKTDFVRTDKIKIPGNMDTRDFIHIYKL